jgi:hypothetical protein
LTRAGGNLLPGRSLRQRPRGIGDETALGILPPLSDAPASKFDMVGGCLDEAHQGIGSAADGRRRHE